MRKRTLKVWNGLVCVYNGAGDNKNPQRSAAVCAYSQKDAVDVINSFSDCYTETLCHFREYWSNCWGNSMNGITPERGLWIEYEEGKPVKAA